MNPLLRYIVSFGSIGLACVMLASAAYLVKKNSPKPGEVLVRFSPPTNPDTPQVDGNEVGSSSDFVSGVGIIEPAGEAITIGSQLPGIVAKIFVEAGDFVEQGKPLLMLDDRTARADVEVARYSLKAQEAKLSELLGQIAPQRARVDASLAIVKQVQAALDNNRRDLRRAEELIGKEAISTEELELRRVNVETTLARLLEAEARHREAQASLDQLDGANGAPSIEVQRVAVEQARAALAKEEVNLQLHTITAPKDCTVLQLKVRVGEFVPATVLANPILTLGVMNPLHVRVDIDESDIPRLKTTARAYASVRGRPNDRVPLTFVRKEPFVIPKRSLTGGVNERVDTRVLQVIYSVAPESIQAVAGQQVDIYIQEAGSQTL